jgi:hypothetical protein
MHHKYWDPIPRAYEQEFEVLEAARIEYNNSIIKLLSDLKANIEEETKNTFSILNTVFGKHILRYEISHNGLPFVEIMAGVSSAWGGPPRTITFSVSLTDKWQALSVLKYYIKNVSSFNFYMQDVNFLFSGVQKANILSTSLVTVNSKDDLNKVKDMYLELIDISTKFLFWLEEKSNPIRGWFLLIKSSFLISEAYLDRDSISPFWAVKNPDFWIRYLPEQSHLEFGFYKNKVSEDIAVRFSKSINSTLRVGIDNDYIGLLATEEDLKTKTEEELVSLICSAYKKFRMLIC